MKDYNRDLFVKPVIIQEFITYIIIVPVVVYFGFFAMDFIRQYPVEFMVYLLGQTVLSLALAVWVKYRFTRPIVRWMHLHDEGRADQELHNKAMRNTAALPLVEAGLILFRWAVVAGASILCPFLLTGRLTPREAVIAEIIICMSGLSSTALFYLLCENTLLPFIRKSALTDTSLEIEGMRRLNLKVKMLLFVFLIALPPMGVLLGLIYMSILNIINLKSIQCAFFLLVGQTVSLICLNGFLLTRAMSLSINDMASMLKNIAHGRGDLTMRLKVNSLDEIGDLAYWFNRFMDNLEEIIAKVKQISLYLGVATQEVSTGSQGLSQTAQEQASSIEELAASVQEMTVAVNHNAAVSSKGVQDTRNMVNIAGESSEMSKELMAAMDEILDASKKVGDIVVTVNDVAFQTNLLALNAAIEAARSGEHGRGFAVVAGEVRNLAQRSAGAARQIKNLIDDTVGKIAAGDTMVRKSSEVLEQIITNINALSGTIEEIAAFSSEQASSIEEFNRAIAEIDSGTQQSASTAEELAGVSEQLDMSTRDLAGHVKHFTVSDVPEASSG